MRFIGLIICLILISSSLRWISVSAEAAADVGVDNSTVDFVLVLDCSGSMKSSDSEDLTTSAAKMFVDMLPAENARLSVVAFGDEYGNEAYDLSQIEGIAKAIDETKSKTSEKILGINQVKVARDLEDITTQESKQQAKAQIDDAVHNVGTGVNNYTPIGFALETACKVLADHGTEPNSAAIILLSDGRLSGQNNGDYDADSYKEALASYSVDRAVTTARSHDWPVYCMELNFDHKNGTSEGSKYDYLYKRAVYQMRENIPETPEEHIELTSATQAQDAFSDIFSKFFEVEPEPIEPMVISNGESSRNFTIGEMVAESNLTLTSSTSGGISQVSDIVLTDPEGRSTSYGSSLEQSDRIITFEQDYITIKLMTPISGEWNITVHGSDGVEIGLYAVTIHEMDLHLKMTETDGVVPKGSTLDFSAAFVYHGNPYVSETVYQKYPATLCVEGPEKKTLDMAGSNENYSTSCTFTESGEYTVYAYVTDAKLFRNGRKESGSYTFSVGNVPTEASDTPIPDQEIGLGEALPEVDLAHYFTNRDNDKLTYTLEYDPASDLSGEITEDGMLRMSAGNQAGTFKVTATAKDMMMETPAEQSFTVTVVNQPLVMKGDVADGETLTVNFSYNAESLPAFLRKISKVPTESEYTLQWSDYFNDPDGGNGEITVTEVSADETIRMSQEAASMHLSAVGKGTATYQIKAVDSNDDAVSCGFLVEVHSWNARVLAWNKIRVPVILGAILIILLVILLLYMFTGKKIYGEWKISTSAKTVEKRRPAKTNGGRRAKCSLNKLLSELKVPGEFPGVELVAGNRLTKKVTIQGFGHVREVTSRGAKVTDAAKLKKHKVVMGKGSSVTIVTKTGERITLQRQS